MAEDYVHRIGRTGRAGKEGEAMSLVCVDEHKLLKDIELPSDNPALTLAAEEKHREFFARKKKARSSASEKYSLQKTLVSKIENRLNKQYLSDLVNFIQNVPQ